MSSLNRDHNHHARGLQSDSQPTAFDPAATSDPSVSIPPLPAYAYTIPLAKRPKVSTNFDHNISSVRANGDSRSDSPDPHDFYRRHQDQYRASLEESSGQGDIRVERREGAMAATGQRSSPLTTRSNAPKLPPLTSRINSRYNSSPTLDRSPLNAAKSSPTLSNTARNRQTSLKDLVDKFNQTPDEALPLPKKSSSRSPSTGSNRGGSSNNVHVKPRNSSLSKDYVDDGGRDSSSTSLQSLDKSVGKSRFNLRNGRTHEGPRSTPRSKRGLNTQRTDAAHNMQHASQSTTNLGQHADDVSRKPLFGEIIGMSPSHPDPGFGIPRARRRRGSEGSMHSPNPMFPQERGRQMHDLSPSSPSAWYLGATPTLEEIKTDRHIPDLPAKLHRRTRSDFSGAPSRPPTSNMYGTDLSPPRDPTSSPTSTTRSKRGSHSRIPISTARRQSTASDSGNSTTSTRASSALGRANMKSPIRPRASDAKYIHTQNPLSPPKHSRSNTPQRSPRRGDFASGIARPATSPRLAAYISAPMPKKSPPLRSSRPRQPVSSASTSASRARAVERSSSHEMDGSKTVRDVKPRKPPELAGVDIAARRQKIQQAVTKTVNEEKRKDEERRASMALSIAPQLHAPDPIHTAEVEDPSYIQGGARTVQANLDHDKSHQIEEKSQDPEGDMHKSERELTINTGHLSERSVLDLSMEDSPTLGAYHRFSAGLIQAQEGGESTPSDVEPSSAITAGTTDSVDTFFDDEPQDDPHDTSPRVSRTHENPTPVSRVGTPRDSSPSPENVRQPVAMEEPSSEVDDRESIQIMLGETPVLEKGSFNEQFHENSTEPQSSESHESRWSMSSWTSSNRSRDDREAPMERIDEHSPVQPAQPAHLSISTSGSQQTPQLWSPQSIPSPRTARTTMDSDTYSTVNRVLDHYHDPSLVSPELMHDIQQHNITQSPDLARQGGWDPKKVTALYLQEIARGKHNQSNSTPNPVKFQIRPRTKIPEVPEKEVREDHHEKMLDSMEREDGEPTPPGTNLSIDQEGSRAARASLTGPDDWDMSPSLGGLEIQAEAIDSPVEDRPKLPPKDWRVRPKVELAEMPDREEAQAPQLTDSQPQLPPIEGLGLDIKVVPPQTTDSPTTPPPPLPFHSPPPPPVELSPPTALRSPPSPSVYSRYSSTYPPASVANDEKTVPPLPSLPSLSSNDTSSQLKSIIPSLHSTGSSSVPQSQERLSVERPSASVDVASKTPSPSPDQKRLTKRRHIIKELVDTEHSFCQDMKVMDDIYRATATDFLLTVEDIKILFGNLGQIINFSTEFLDALKQGSRSVYTLAKSKRWKGNRVSNATSHSGNTDDQSSINGADLNDEEKDRRTFVGEAFGHHMTCMEKVYTDYLKNHDAANQKLQALQKDTTISVWLKECHTCAQDLTSAWDLDSLLVKPVQRILKYPLLLDQLVEATPENHPDFTALDVAAREMKGMAKRIDETKKRADLMERVTNPRKRKESDGRIGLSKAFGRRTEKLRQQVGLSDMVEDKVYSTVSEKFGSHFFQLQVVMRDVEMYTNDVQIFMNRFCDFALAIEAHIEVSQTSYPELESKWRKFRMSTREMSMTALTDHVSAVRKNVIEPMTTLLKLQDGPQKLMQKRNKRLADFARFKAVKDRGEKPDKKTIEQGEQFQAINETLKDELPKLFALTGKLVESCLNNFVQLQLQWHIVWRRKLSQAIDDNKIPVKAQDIVDAFKGDFAFFEAQVLSLGVCNGSMLNEVANQISLLSPTTTLNGDDASTRQASNSSSLDLSKQRTLSVSSDKSPVIPHPDFGGRSSGSLFPLGDGVQLAPFGNYVSAGRVRASSTLSGHTPRTPEVPGSYHSYSNNTTPVTSTAHRPATATPRTYTEPSPAIPRSSIENPPSSGSSQPRDISDPQRYSGFFSSAMPMSDSPQSQSPAPRPSSKEFNVIFLAASVYEFNIDRARKEAGYPYLTYVAGEIFDVIGEKGELWLAKNQDDSTNEVGWIWNKHFVKLAS